MRLSEFLDSTEKWVLEDKKWLSSPTRRRRWHVRKLYPGELEDVFAGSKLPMGLCLAGVEQLKEYCPHGKPGLMVLSRLRRTFGMERGLVTAPHEDGRVFALVRAQAGGPLVVAMYDSYETVVLSEELKWGK